MSADAETAVITVDIPAPPSTCRDGGRSAMPAASVEVIGHARASSSLVQTCKHLQIHPFGYLREVIERVWTHPAGLVLELTVREWKRLRPDRAAQAAA